MSVLELKQQIHQKIDSITDKSELEELNKTLDSILSDDLSDAEVFLLKRLNRAINDANKGKLIAHKQVMTDQRSWLESKRPAL